MKAHPKAVWIRSQRRQHPAHRPHPAHRQHLIPAMARATTPQRPKTCGPLSCCQRSRAASAQPVHSRCAVAMVVIRKFSSVWNTRALRPSAATETMRTRRRSKWHAASSARRRAKSCARTHSGLSSPTRPRARSTSPAVKASTSSSSRVPRRVGSRLRTWRSTTTLFSSSRTAPRPPT